MQSCDLFKRTGFVTYRESLIVGIDNMGIEGTPSIFIPTKEVDRISYEASTVFASPAGAAVKQRPAPQLG